MACKISTADSDISFCADLEGKPTNASNSLKLPPFLFCSSASTADDSFIRSSLGYTYKCVLVAISMPISILETLDFSMDYALPDPQIWHNNRTTVNR